VTSTNVGPSIRSDRVPLGILYMFAATLLFAASFALSKWLVADYSFAEVLFFRSVGSLAVCAAFILPRSGLAVFRTQRLSAHVVRNVTQGSSQALVVVALGLMPLAGVVAINFSAPIFAALFAAIFLHEKIGRQRGTALLVGFLGVLLVASPGADSFRLGAIFALANAITYGSVTTAVRGLSATESVETLTMYQMVCLTILFAIAMMLFGFTMPTAATAGALLLNGALNGVGQYAWTRSLSLAPPAAVGPFYYFSLVWALVLGFLFWGDVPTLPLLAGSAVVVGSGLFLLWHESARKAPPTTD
jgi:drug/metabolite transporter (DMT)-like permease